MVLKNPSVYEKDKTIVLLVRHGEKESLYHDLIRRIPGPHLTKKGHEQAKQLASKLKKYDGQIDKIYTSMMIRTIETASYVQKVLHLKAVSYFELCEVNNILWSKRYYHINYWKHYLNFRNAISRFEKILKHDKGKFIVIVCHGNIIKGILGHYLKIPRNKRGLIGYEECAITRMEFDGIKLVYVRNINDYR